MMQVSDLMDENAKAKFYRLELLMKDNFDTNTLRILKLEEEIK